jgi:hypothetical protein
VISFDFRDHRTGARVRIDPQQVADLDEHSASTIVTFRDGSTVTISDERPPIGSSLRQRLIRWGWNPEQAHNPKS